MSLECDKACAVISSTTMSNPNNERILCVDHNGNIIYLSREDLQRAYDTILETAVTEYSRRMGMHTGNVRESRSEKVHVCTKCTVRSRTHNTGNALCSNWSSSSEDMPTADEFTSQTESSSFSLSGRTYWPELEFEMDEMATSAFEFYLRQREEMLRPRRRM
ncbi:ABC transporter G family member [Trichinella spiralis]|uniref:ABC transporter G family member n=1 Tax=Trichinella spiralis TaxID=6334 RepID=A0ABR3KEM8_TRISP